MGRNKRPSFVLDADLLTLRAVVAVVDEGNFSAAARKIGRSQSAVSLQIAKLEDRMEVLLFERTSRSVKLTPAGEVFSAYARRIVDLANEGLAAVRIPEISEPLRIGFAEYLVPQHLHQLLSRFKRRYPKARIDLRLGIGGNLHKELTRDELDIVVAGPEGEGGLLLLEEALVWVGPRHEPPPMEAHALELILMQPPCSYRKAAFDSLAQAEMPWNVAINANSIQGVQSAVAAGLGISIIPRSAVNDQVKIIREGFPKLPATTIEAHCNTTGRHPLTNRFIEFLKEELSDIS